MKVKLLRIQRGLSQAELCKLVKTSPRKMVEIERGNFDTVTIALGKKIAAVLETTFEELFLNN